MYFNQVSPNNRSKKAILSHAFLAAGLPRNIKSFLMASSVCMISSLYLPAYAIAETAPSEMMETENSAETLVTPENIEIEEAGDSEENPVAAVEQTPPPTPENFESSVAYLLEYPEVLSQVVNEHNYRNAVAQAQLVAEKIANNKEAIFDSENMPIIGNPDGSVVFTLLTDASCIACQDQQRILEKFTSEHDDVKIILKETPIVSDKSATASLFSMAAFDIGGLNGYNRAKLGATLVQEWDMNNINFISNLTGLDINQVVANMQSENMSDMLIENVELAKNLEIDVLPTLIVKDRMVSGIVTLEALQDFHASLNSEE